MCEVSAMKWTILTENETLNFLVSRIQWKKLNNILNKQKKLTVYHYKNCKWEKNNVNSSVSKNVIELNLNKKNKIF